MNPDITRDTFDRRKHFARVLLQQGRVTLDADANEQTAILLHLLRSLARDLYGPHGGLDIPAPGFELLMVDDQQGRPADLAIRPGQYYVGGILCENEPLQDPATGVVPDPTKGCTYLTQPDYYLPPGSSLPKNPYLAYLDAWERPIGYLEDPSIREVALGCPDTAARSRVVWQVRTIEKDLNDSQLSEELQPTYRGFLRARVSPSEASTDPCIISPESRYRGAENQLYRVEVHKGGAVGTAAGAATFKWSRDNGSVCFAVRKLSGDVALLESLGPDRRRGLTVNDWVEVVDTDLALHGDDPCPLAQVADVDLDGVAVRLTPKGDLTKLPWRPGAPLYLRRWDHPGRPDAAHRPAFGTDGALLIQEDGWIGLEDGVQIQFSSDGGNPNTYRTGDYWLIPARVAGGNVEWPGGPDGKTIYALPPHGPQHHYAVLASVNGATVTPRLHLIKFA